MKSPLSTLLQISGDMLETGLMAVHTALETMQGAVETITNQKRAGQLTAPPVDGPKDIDSAVSDFANRMTRIAWFTPWDTAELGAASQEILAAARRSFGYVDLGDPRSVAFPVQLALSVGTLMVQQSLRGLVSYEVVAARNYPRFLLDAIEVFTDTSVFVGLEYRELLAKYEARLESAPDDDATRVELGRTLLKCGLYEDAARNLLQASSNPSVRALALHEAAVALSRAGKLESSAKAGSDALSANPGNERTLSWLWLTAQKMGGYPAFVPAMHRMQMRVGYDKPTVQFEDIAAKIGLDKTSAARGIAVFDYNNDELLD